MDNLLDDRMATWLLANFPINVVGLSEYPDVFAFTITMLFTLGIAIGAKESSRLNTIFTVTNLAVVIYVIVVG